jgi:hypothetical protein
MLFVVGGNGTHAGANAIHEEVIMSLLFFSFFIQRYIFLPICDLLRS